MARANLKIAAELTAAFESACTNGAIRFLTASISGERIVCGAATAAGPSAEDDFEALVAEKVSPQYYLWNQDPCT